MNEQTIRFRLGIFVLASLIVLAVLIILFGGTPRFFRAADHYTITFANAAGLGPGTPVRRSGVKIGEVESLQLDDQTGEVVVDIRVESKYQIPKSEEPIITSGLLGGDVSIDFVPVEASGKKVDKSALKPGVRIKGKTQVPAQALVQKADKTLTPTKDAMEQIKKVFEKLDKMAPLIEGTFKAYRELAKNAGALAPEVNKTNKEIQKLVKATTDALPDLKRTNNEIQVTARNWSKVGERLDVLLQTNEKKFVKSLEQLETTLAQVAKVFSDENVKNFDVTLRNVAKSSKRLDSIAQNTEDLLEASQKTMGRVGSSIERADRVFKNLEKVTTPMAKRSKSILKNLDEATGELNKATVEVRTLMRQVARNKGTVQKLLTDPSLYNNLDKAAGAVNRVLPRLDRILRDVEIFADKIARHPEVIGIGGVVRPSSGLKNLPIRSIWRSKGP